MSQWEEVAVADLRDGDIVRCEDSGTWCTHIGRGAGLMAPIQRTYFRQLSEQDD